VRRRAVLLRISQRHREVPPAIWRSFLEWIEAYAQKRPEAFAHLMQRHYDNGQVLKVGDRQYKLQLHFKDRKTLGGKIKEGGELHLNLPRGYDPAQDQGRPIKQLISRLIARDFYESIARRVDYWNDKYFGVDINKIVLKYNFYTWGSCSNKGNINLSTRLLFAPGAVIDYVIIHELAHFKEFNHSQRFWRIVEEIMPDYRKKEAWLKQHFYTYDF